MGWKYFYWRKSLAVKIVNHSTTMAGLNTLFSVLLNKYNPSQWGYFQQNKFQDFRNCIKFSTDAQDSLDITSFSIEITFSSSSSLLHIVTSDTSLVYSNLPAMNFVPIKTRVLSTSPSRLSPPSALV